MKYKKHIATGALAFSLLVSGAGTSVFAANPRDLGIKQTHQTYQRPNKNEKDLKAKKRRGNSIVGTVGAINGSGFTLELKNLRRKTASSFDVKTDDETVYMKNGISAEVSDLAVGEKVIAVGNFDKTTNVATAKIVKIVTLSR